jgi:hypothetical protein
MLILMLRGLMTLKQHRQLFLSFLPRQQFYRFPLLWHSLMLLCPLLIQRLSLSRLRWMYLSPLLTQWYFHPLRLVVALCPKSPPVSPISTVAEHEVPLAAHCEKGTGVFLGGFEGRGDLFWWNFLRWFSGAGK